MRYCVAVLCVLACMLAGLAQGGETLALSKSMIAVKITQPEKQLAVFAPVLNMIDGLFPTETPGAPNAKATMTNVTAMLQDLVESLKRLPGVDAQGSLWVAVMPPALGEDIPPVIEVDGVMKPNPDLMPPIYLVLPLTDPQAFRTYYAQGNPTTLRYTICGKYAVGHMTKAPSFTAVNLDLSLITARDVALSVQMANYDLSQMAVPPMLEPMVQPVLDVMQEQQENVERVEVGLTMVGRDLSMDSFAIPVPGSPLARSLAAPKLDTTAFDYAGYLPKNLAYCGASGRALVGAPGTAQFMMRIGFGILAAFLPEDRGQALTKSLSALMTQCSQGRAIGIIGPENADAGATMVAVYRVANEREARSAARAFVKELVLTRDSVMNGMLANVVTFDLKPDAEKIEGLAVDRIELKMAQPPAPPANEAPADGGAPAPVVAPVPFALDGRVAYLGDKMLVTLGYGSTPQMAALIKRVRQPDNAGFTASRSYESLKGSIAEKSVGFESITLRDLSMVVTSWFPPNQRKEAMMFLAMFPPQNTPITTFQEIKDGRLHGGITIPGGQLDFLYSLVKAAQTMRTPAPQ
ncbi:MAG: hypothetical protein ACYDCO_22070 [Armatimonadota bacterium]